MLWPTSGRATSWVALEGPIRLTYCRGGVGHEGMYHCRSGLDGTRGSRPTTPSTHHNPSRKDTQGVPFPIARMHAGSRWYTKGPTAIQEIHSHSSSTHCMPYNMLYSISLQNLHSTLPQCVQGGLVARSRNTCTYARRRQQQANLGQQACVHTPHAADARPRQDSSQYTVEDSTAVGILVPRHGAFTALPAGPVMRIGSARCSALPATPHLEASGAQRT